jgi:hypothetical protein
MHASRSFAVVAVALLCAVVLVKAHNEPHPLDLINVHDLNVHIDPSISLSVSPSQLTHVSEIETRSEPLTLPLLCLFHQTDWVTSTWSGVSNPDPVSCASHLRWHEFLMLFSVSFFTAHGLDRGV